MGGLSLFQPHDRFFSVNYMPKATRKSHETTRLVRIFPTVMAITIIELFLYPTRVRSFATRPYLEPVGLRNNAEKRSGEAQLHLSEVRKLAAISLSFISFYGGH